MRKISASTCIWILPALLSVRVQSAGVDQDQRISVRKCEEYKQLYMKINEKSPGGTTRYAYGDLRCPYIAVRRVIGGRDAALDEFPHMVSLQHRHRNGKFYHVCGGTLISENYVLTAAHCVKKGKKMTKAVLGDTSLYRHDPRLRRRELPIEKIIIHKDFNMKNIAYNDIALVKLNGSLEFRHDGRPSIRPACLAQPGQSARLRTVTATGWGKTAVKNESRILQAVEMTVEANHKCAEAYKEELQEYYTPNFPLGLWSKIICAGDGEEIRGTCQGDSGGPLTIKAIAGQFCIDYVVGITSGGARHCDSLVAGIYTRVDNYIDWIEEIVWRS